MAFSPRGDMMPRVYMHTQTRRAEEDKRASGLAGSKIKARAFSGKWIHNKQHQSLKSSQNNLQ